MAKVTICDFRDDTGNPCGNRGDVEVSLRWADKNWSIDLCDVHSKSLTANAREQEVAAPQPRPPKAGTGTGDKRQQLVDQVDYPELRKWAEHINLLQEGSKGIIKREIQERWIAEGSPREVADGTFRTSEPKNPYGEPPF